MKKVLIIGGSSSICDKIITYLEENEYEIDLMTHSDHSKANEKYKWQHLDLMGQESTENLINILSKNYYDKIICVPTYNSGTKNPFETSRKYLINVYGNFIVNYMILIRNLLSNLKDDGQLIYISSAAANRPVHMVDYSAAKACMQAYVTSLSTQVKEGQAIFSIAPSMIYESNPYYQQGYYKNDIYRLVKKEEIAKVIVEADSSYNGKVVCIGFVPSSPKIILRQEE